MRGGSTLITSAPRSARILPLAAAAIEVLYSTMRDVPLELEFDRIAAIAAGSRCSIFPVDAAGLRTELGGPDIARELVVSLSTVRSHTKAIYSKLGVNSRRAAVHRGLDLGLLSGRDDRQHDDAVRGT